MTASLRAVVLGVGVLVAAQSGAFANLLSNGDLSSWDDPNHPSGWTVESLAMVNVEREAQITYSPPYSAKLTRGLGGTGNNYGLKQYIVAQPRTAYTVAAWCYDDNVDARGGISITWCRADSTSLGNSGVAYSDSAIHSWQHIAKTDTAPDSAVYAKVLVRAYGFTGQPAGGFVCFDNLEFDVGAGGIHEQVTAGLPALLNVATVASHRGQAAFSLPSAGEAALSLYDLTGSLRSVFFRGRLAAGSHAVAFSVGDEIPDGLYFLVLSNAGHDVAVRKLIVRR